MPGYRVEYANSARAKCNGRKPCKGTPIAKGQLRFGTWVTLHEHGSFKWRHWGCLTSSVLKNVSNELDSKIEELDGFEELREEDRAKVKKAFEEGQIDPDDVPSTAVPEKVKSLEADEGEDEKENPKKRKRGPAKKSKLTSQADGDQGQDQDAQDNVESDKKTKKKKSTPKPKPKPSSSSE